MTLVGKWVAAVALVVLPAAGFGADALRPSMPLVVIEGATHGSAMREPEFIAAVRDFIASNRAKPGR